MPDHTDQAALQRFFFDEIQKGEELLAAGEYEESVKHLTNAIAISGQPQQLLQVFQQTLPPDVFKMLMNSLATTKSTTASAQVIDYLSHGLSVLSLSAQSNKDESWHS